MTKAAVTVVVAHAILCVSLAAEAVSGCGIARADGGVGAYLNGLEDKGIGGDSLRLEQLGEACCRVMRLGNNYAVAVAGVQGQGLAPSEARILAFQAAIDLCPDVIATASVPPPPIHSGGLPGDG
jgi:hypothetical protein